MSSTPVKIDPTTITPLQPSQPDPASTLRQSVAYGAAQNPDQYAKLLKLKQQTGVPPEAAQGNEQEVQHAADVNSLDYETLVASHPRTTAWATNPDNAAVAGVGEVQRVADIEKNAGVIRALTPWESFKSDYIYPAQKKLTEYPLTRMAIDAVGSTVGMAGNVASFFGLHGDGPTKQNILQRIETGLEPEQVGLKSNGLDWLAKNVAPMIPALIATGGTSLVAKTLGMSERAAKVFSAFSIGGLFTADQGGKTYTSVAGSGQSDYDARLKANQVAAINAAPNTLMGLTGFIPKERPNLQLLSSVGAGGLAGATGQYSQNVITGQPWHKEVIASALQGAAMQGGMHLGTEVFFDHLGQAISATETSKLKERSPEAFHDAMQKVFEGDPSLRIPVDQFMEYFHSKGMSPQNVAEQLGAKNYAEAVVSGVDVEVPTADFLAKLDAEHQKNLLTDIVDPVSGMTLRQHEEARKELDAFVSSGGPEKLVAEAAQADAETASTPEYVAAKEDLRQRYIDAGETPEVAETLATKDANAFSNIAKSAGMKTDELLAMYRPKVTAGEAPGGERLNQASIPHVEFDESGNIVDADGRHRVIAALERGDNSIAIETKLRDGSVQTLHVNPQLVAQKMGVTPESLRATDAQQAEFFKTLYQSEDSGQPRGWFRVLPDGSFEIGRTKIGDLSTFVHEPAHGYLKIISDLATREGASENIKGDYAKILDFLGAKRGEELTTEQHEKWARANEQYLREGKAPSEGLKGVFQRFAVWLSSVYKKASELGVELNDDIRGVFDRLYASEDGVNRAAAEDGPRLFQSAEEAGWTDEQFKAYAESRGVELDQAKAEILAKLNEAALREKTDAWREEEKNVREALTAEIDRKPEYAAIRSLRKGALDDGTELKLNREALVKQFGEERVKGLQKQHPGLYRNEGGVDPETAAEILGFNSGEAMMKSLESSPRRSAAIAEATRAYMTEKHGDIRYDGTLQDQARLALENEKRSENLYKELKALQKKVSELKAKAKDQKAAMRAIQVAPIESYREAARKMVDSKSIADLQPNRYLDASRKYSREAFDSLRKGDVEEAAQAKHKELLNHFLFREATAVRAEADKALNYTKKFSRATVREKIAKAGGDQGQHVYLDQIDNILDMFGLGSRAGRPSGQRQTLTDFAAQQQAKALADFFALNPTWATDHPNEAPELPLMVDPSIADLAKNYRQLNAPQLRSVVSALKNIETIARNEYGFIRDGKLVSYAQEVADFERVAREKVGVKPVPRAGTKFGAKENVSRAVQGIDAYMQKMEWLVDALDGGDIEGPARRNIKKPIDDAWGKSLAMGDEIFGKLEKLVGERPKEDVRDIQEPTGIQFPQFDRPLTRKQLISWALNLGTEENQKVALLGEGLILPDGSHSPLVDQALRSLRTSELKFIQGVWDILDGMLPAVREKALRTTGIDPKLKKVIPFEVVSADGDTVKMRGGYYPLKAEPGERVGMKQYDPANLMAVGYQRPKTSNSHLQQVTGATYRLNLNYESVLSRHLADVINDTTKGEAIAQVYKFISEDGVRQTIRETLGDKYEPEFLKWLQDFASDNKSAAHDSSPLLDFLLSRRSGMVAARLGGNLGSYLIQVGDVFKSLADADIKTSYLMKAFIDIRTKPTATIEMIRELSPNEMKFREKNFNRDIRDMLTDKNVFDHKKQVATEFLMEGFQVMDRLVTFPVWLARYRQGLDAHGDATRAAAEADRAVARDYQAGDNRNMSRMMRQGGWTRLVTTFQGDANTWYSMISASVRSGDAKRISVGLLALVMEQIVGQFIKNRGPKDDENKLGWVMQQVLAAGLGKVPVLGDIGQYAADKAMGKYSTLQNPTMQGIEKTASVFADIPAVKAGTKSIAGDLAPDAFEATGIYMGIPGTSQAVRTWKYIHRVNVGKEPEPANALEAVRSAVMGTRR